MAQTAHTPTPWDKSHIYTHSGCGCCTEGFDESDVEFIVRACNAHDDLVAALDLLNQHWSEDFPDGPDGEKADHARIHESTRIVWRNARKALSKARGEQS